MIIIRSYGGSKPSRWSLDTFCFSIRSETMSVLVAEIVGKISALEQTMDVMLGSGIDTNGIVWQAIDKQLDSLKVQRRSRPWSRRSRSRTTAARRC